MDSAADVGLHQQYQHITPSPPQPPRSPPPVYGYINGILIESSPTQPVSPEEAHSREVDMWTRRTFVRHPDDKRTGRRQTLDALEEFERRTGIHPYDLRSEETRKRERYEEWERLCRERSRRRAETRVPRPGEATADTEDGHDGPEGDLREVFA